MNIPDKFVTQRTDGVHAVLITEISPEWADYMEAFAKEMARAVVENEILPDGYCTRCGGYSPKHKRHVITGDPCKVIRAQEYLKGR